MGVDVVDVVLFGYDFLLYVCGVWYGFVGLFCSVVGVGLWGFLSGV